MHNIREKHQLHEEKKRQHVQTFVRAPLLSAIKIQIWQRISSTDSEELTAPRFDRFMYEWLPGNKWVTGEREALYLRTRNSQPRNQMIQQGIGPVTLITGDFSEPFISMHNPNTLNNLQINQL